MKPPPRLIDDPNAPPGLRADLERAADAPFAYDAAAGLAGLQASIGSLASTAAASAPPAAASMAPPAAASVAPPAMAVGKVGALLGSAGGKLALVAAGAAVMAAASVALWPTDSQQTRPSASPNAAAPQTIPATPSTQPQQQPANARAQDAPAAVPEPTAARAKPGAARRAARDPDAAMRLEIAELGRIRALLASDPEQAHRLANAGHRRFGRGMLRQEREGLAILALWKMGRRDDAERRSELFLARYPRSPLRAELERELQLERPSRGESD